MNRFDAKTEQLRKEIEELERAQNGGNAPPNEQEQEEVVNEIIEEVNQPIVEAENTQEENLSVDEARYKKRYGDLRRHTQKQIGELKNEIEALKAKAPALPSSMEEAKEWAEKNPKAAAIIRALVTEQSSDTERQLNDRLRELEDQKAAITREKEEAKIRKVHEDFDDLQNSADFHDWVEGQPEAVQNMVYDGDAKAVITAINFYKLEKGISSKTTERDAARNPGRSGRAAVNDRSTGKTFKESEISRMTIQEYEANEADIVEAQRKGRIIYDITGAAR